MVKKYRGNSGRVEWVGAPEGPPPVQSPPSPPPQIQPSAAPAPPPPLPGGWEQLLAQRLLQPLRELEAEDLLLALILYLLYRESGDTELLLILGIMLFL